jgi:hypothetical protein
MSTAGEIISQAFREPNLTPIGHVTTAAEIADALPRLNNLLFALFGVEIGGEYRNWHVLTVWTSAQEQRHPLTPLTDTTSTAPWAYPPENSRLLVTISSARTIYFPALPSDGARMMFRDIGSSANPTLHGSGQLIEGGLTLTDTPVNLDGAEWLYRGDLGGWIRLSPISAAGSVMPLPTEFDDFFVTGLATRLAPRFGIAPAAETVARYDEMRSRILSRYKDRVRSAAELRSLIRTTP